MYKYYMKAQTLHGAGIDRLHEQTEKHKNPTTWFRTTLNYKISF